VKQRTVALEWSNRVAAVAHGHYLAASRYSRLHFWLGLPTVLLATIVGTSVFAMLQKQPEVWWQITVGLMSITAAVLSALQSFLNYSDKTEKHRTAGARYNAIGRELEQLLAQEDKWSSLDSIRNKIDQLSQQSPHIPSTVRSSIADISERALWEE
jgi:hypothetical protein